MLRVPDARVSITKTLNKWFHLDTFLWKSRTSIPLSSTSLAQFSRNLISQALLSSPTRDLFDHIKHCVLHQTILRHEDASTPRNRCTFLERRAIPKRYFCFFMIAYVNRQLTSYKRRWSQAQRYATSQLIRRWLIVAGDGKTRRLCEQPSTKFNSKSPLVLVARVVTVTQLCYSSADRIDIYIYWASCGTHAHNIPPPTDANARVCYATYEHTTHIRVGSAVKIPSKGKWPSRFDIYLSRKNFTPQLRPILFIETPRLWPWLWHWSMNAPFLIIIFNDW